MIKYEKNEKIGVPDMRRVETACVGGNVSDEGVVDKVNEAAVALKDRAHHKGHSIRTSPAGHGHEGHRQRMKARFLSEGLASFSSHQILELLLFFGIPYRDTNEAAHMLLNKYGSLSNVFNADYYELSALPGIGSHAAILIRMIPDLARSYTMDRWKSRTQIVDSKSAGLYAVSLFIGFEYEAFYMICLDSQNKVIHPVLISEGTINEAMIYPRLIVENALRYKTAAVIFTHNHPGGSIEPSNADIDLTKKLKTALNVISVKTIDHIIVAGEDYISLAEKRLV